MTTNSEQPQPSPATRPSRARVTTDAASFVLSWVLIFEQALRPSTFHLAFLVLAGVMSGVPAAVAAANTVLQRGQKMSATELSSGTTGQSTQSP